MLEGATIRLRPWSENDVAVMTQLRNDVALQSQLLARVRGSSEQQVRDWLQDRSSSSKDLFFIIADRTNDQALGFLQVAGIDPVDRRGELGICLAAGAQGHGAGTQAIQLLLPYLRDTWHFHKLSLRVRADNLAAIRCYRKLAFEEVGRLREHTFIDGHWHDLVLMDIFLRH